MLKQILAFVKKHIGWGLFTTTLIGWGGVWIAKVNATGEEVVQMKVIVPRIEAQLTDISHKQDDANKGITEIKERVSKMEGRLSR